MVNPSLAQINELIHGARGWFRAGGPVSETLNTLLASAVYNNYDLTRDQAIRILEIAQRDYFIEIDAAPGTRTPAPVEPPESLPRNPFSVQTMVWSDEGGAFTDLRVALRIAELFGPRIRYCPGWSKETPWFYYDGARWCIDRHAYIDQCYHDVAQTYTIEIETQLQEIDTSTTSGSAASNALAKAIGRFQSIQKHNSTLSQLTTVDSLIVIPDEMDMHHNLLNLQNYTYNLQNHTLQQHNPDDMLTKLVPVDYDTSSQCPGFLQFLERIQPDEAIRTFLQRWFGYCLTGTTSEQCLLIFHGVGGNGKSVLINTMTRILSDYAVTFEMDVFSDKYNDKADLIKAQMKGARLISAVETRRQDVRLNEGLIKRLTGGDEVVARVLYGMPFRYTPTYKVVLSLNHAPIIGDTSHSMWRRIWKVPFNIIIPEEERDKTLEDRLYEERAGILIWLLEGLRQYQSIGLAVPPAMVETTAEYREQQDIHADFITTCLELDRDKKDQVLHHEEFAEDVRKTYLKWCNSIQIHPIPPQRFPSWMTENRIFQCKTNGRRKYRGLLIKSDWIVMGDAPRPYYDQKKFPFP